MTSQRDPDVLSQDELAQCLALLAKARSLPVDDPSRRRIGDAARALMIEAKREKRRQREAKVRERDQALRAQCEQYESRIPSTGDDSVARGVIGTLQRARRCALCH